MSLNIVNCSGQSSFNTPVYHEDFDFIERQLDKSNKQYQATLEKDNKSNSSKGDEQVFVSYKHSYQEWNDTINNWGQEHESHNKITIHFRQKDIQTFKSETKLMNTFYKVNLDSSTSNEKNSFLRWNCRDDDGVNCKVVLYLDKVNQLIFVFISYYHVQISLTIFQNE